MDLVKSGVRIIRNKGFRIFRINMVLKQYRNENTFLLVAEMIFASNENCKAVSPNRGKRQFDVLCAHQQTRRVNMISGTKLW